MTIVSGFDTDWCTTDTNLPALCDDGNGYPVAIYRDIVPRFIRKEANAGIETGGRQVVASAQMVLQVLV